MAAVFSRLWLRNTMEDGVVVRRDEKRAQSCLELPVEN